MFCCCSQEFYHHTNAKDKWKLRIKRTENLRNQTIGFSAHLSHLARNRSLFPLCNVQITSHPEPTITQHSLAERSKMAAGSHAARVDSVKRPFALPPAVMEVKTRSSQMVPQRSSSRWQVSEGGEMQLSLLDWVNSCGVQFVQHLRQRACNSICSWPTVLPRVGIAARALLRKIPNEEMSQRAPLLSKSQASGVAPRVPVLFVVFSFQRSSFV